MVEESQNHTIFLGCEGISCILESLHEQSVQSSTNIYSQLTFKLQVPTTEVMSICPNCKFAMIVIESVWIFCLHSYLTYSSQQKLSFLSLPSYPNSCASFKFFHTQQSTSTLYSSPQAHLITWEIPCKKQSITERKDPICLEKLFHKICTDHYLNCYKFQNHGISMQLSTMQHLPDFKINSIISRLCLLEPFHRTSLDHII